MRVRLVSALVIVSAYGALQYWWLPPDGFFSGDSGTKYLQARAVAEHGPMRPWVEGPALDIDPGHRWQEPFLLRQNGHLVGVFSWLFALLTAPFLRLFGIPGLYVLPAVSMAVMFLGTSAIGRALGQPAGGAWSGWVAVVATPLLVYGAELWEHAPAVALSTISAALLIKADGAKRDAFLAAVCAVLAFALRPEAVVVLPALLAARAWTGGLRSAVRDWGALAAGGLAAGTAIAAMNAAIHGAAIPPQVSSNFEAGFSYLSMRREALLSLVLPMSHPGMFIAGVAVAAAGAFSRAARVRQACLYAAMGLMLGAAVFVPLWRAQSGHLPWLGTFEVRSLANTWPLVLVPCCYLAAGATTLRERTLLVATLVTLLLVFVTLPHTGGAQWSARFFLPAAPLVAALAVERLRSAGARGLTALLLAASIALEIGGLVLVRQARRVNAQITRTTATLTQPGDVIASDLFWYPEVTATLYPSRRLLFAWSPADFGAIASAAAERGFGSFWLVTAPQMTGYVPPSSFPAGAGLPPFVQTRTRDAGLSSLMFYKYERK